VSGRIFFTLKEVNLFPERVFGIHFDLNKAQAISINYNLILQVQPGQKPGFHFLEWFVSDYFPYFPEGF